MPLFDRQQGPIAVYGATGYTGRLVAAELARAEAEFVLSGRSRDKLESLALQLGGMPAVEVASLEDPDSLRGLLEDCAAVIDCAGPFLLHGEPVLRAAIETSTHYLDTTGEQPYMQMAFERHGPEAQRAGVAVIPAMGFDYVPGDMLASLTAEGMGDLDEVLLAYDVQGFSATHGTALSSLEILKGGDVEWRKLQWLPASQSFGRGSYDFGEPLGEQGMVRYPAGEQITVPRHIPTRRVRTMISARTLAPHPALGPLLQLVGRPAGLAMRTPLRRLLGAAISRLPEGPSEEERASARFTIACEVRRGRRLRRGRISGRDVYGLTAAAISRGAMIAAGRRFSGRGALAPSEAFEPAAFLRGLERFEVAWELEPELDSPVAVAV